MAGLKTRAGAGTLLAVVLTVLAGVAIVHHWHGPGSLHDHGHDHGIGLGAGAPQLTLNTGQKWETDAPLRLGMERIRALADGLSPDADAAGRQAFVSGLQEQVDFLVANCKLPPEADRSLHALIVDMLEGAKAVASEDDPAPGLVLIRKTLETYPVYFAHPGWRPVEGGAAAP